tara:strand:- start:3145 stop:4584 length:1440 start_codon:yes stop_codon:yes gene_type:complete
VAGFPESLLVQPDGYSFDREHLMEITSFTETSLSVSLRDLANNIASVDSLRNIKLIMTMKRMFGSTLSSYPHMRMNMKKAELPLQSIDFSKVIPKLEKVFSSSSDSSGHCTASEEILVNLSCTFMISENRVERSLSATLRCKLVNTKRVKSMELLKSGELVSRELETSVDEGLPELAIRFQCEDMQPYLPPLESWGLILVYEKAVKKSKDDLTLELGDYYDISGDCANTLYHLNPKVNGPEPLRLGNYRLSLCYRECREELLSVIPECLRKSEAIHKIRVLPGKPFRLFPDQKSQSLLSSNTPRVISDSSSGDRLLARDIRMIVNDKWNNPSYDEEFFANHSVVCILSRPTEVLPTTQFTQGFSDDLVVPQLINARNGMYFGEYDQKKKWYRFPSIEIAEGTGKGEGHITLKFKVVFNGDESDVDLETYSVNFRFTSNASEARKEEEFRKRLEPHKEKQQALKIDLKEKEDNMSDIMER